ncbi:MAG TPA: hydroxymethylbilane synthase [Acidimicrobiales bacterium]|nr:hydroxymethylbilane synthase [Acidimicrobiales bacterium]
MSPRWRAATRGSPLALWQTRRVASLLGGDVEEVVVQTTGDRRADAPIHEMGGQGVFVREVQAAVLEGRADFAVHSAKDLQPRVTPGLALACVPERGDPRDALVGTRLDDLPPGARVATGSVRRRAQLAWLRPDLTFSGLRGNIGTRLEKAGQFDAIVMAAAALDRLGRLSEAADILDPSVLLPQVGQGALAVECRQDDAAATEALAALDHGASRAELDAERAFLDTLGGGCDLPVGALARWEGGAMTMDVLVAGLDGRTVLRRRQEMPAGGDPAAFGVAAAQRLLEGGAATVLAGGDDVLAGGDDVQLPT